MYTWLRAKESELAWSQVKFEQVVKKACLYEKAVNIEEASRYINEYCADYRDRLHGMPTLSKEEAREFSIRQKSKGAIRPTFKF